MRVAAAADGRANNPFESVLRAVLHEAGLTTCEPQGQIRLGRRLVRPDLVDREALLVIEADSFAHHGSPDALSRDCERYDSFTAAGWTVLRFTYRRVMCRPEWVARIVLETRRRLLARRGGA